MKYVIILPDGASDEPLAQLGGRTPLEAARIPHMDSIAREGWLGRIVTIPEGFGAGTDAGTLTLMGYDPHRYHTGRAPMEALAQQLTGTTQQAYSDAAASASGMNTFLFVAVGVVALAWIVTRKS